MIFATSPLPILTLNGVPIDGPAGTAGAGAATAGAAVGAGAAAAADDAGAAAGPASLAFVVPPEQEPRAMPSTRTPAGMRKRFFLKNGRG